jgi:hypothetical protein
MTEDTRPYNEWLITNPKKLINKELGKKQQDSDKDLVAKVINTQ